MNERKQLKRTYVLIDGRHPVKKIDREFIETLEKMKCKYQIVLTKTDLVKEDKLVEHHNEWKKIVDSNRRAMNRVLMISARYDKGVHILRSDIYNLVHDKNAREKK